MRCLSIGGTSTYGCCCKWRKAKYHWTMHRPDSNGPLSKDHVVLVAKNLHQECLLGADCLMRHGCVLDLQQKIMFTEQGPVHFVSSVY